MITLIPMLPEEYQNRGEALTINYSFAQSPFGSIIVASTSKGICCLFFEEDQTKALADLQKLFQKAKYRYASDVHQENAIAALSQKESLSRLSISLHIHGTTFQLAVWNALLTVPSGSKSTYSAIARQIGNPKAYRAVGIAVGSNPVAYFIPCHRVVRSNGALGGYRWGIACKEAILNYEL